MAVTEIVTGARPRVRVAGNRWRASASLRTGWILCVALVVVALLFRLVLMSTVFGGVDSDQAVLGVMAYHVQRGELPIFYYGQPYTGSLEAYIAAAVFQAFGANDFTLRVPALLFSAGFAGIVFWLGAVLYGYRIATLAGLFVALAPSIMIKWSLAAGANYIEIACCGALLLLLAVLYPDLRAMPPRIALLLGFVAGLGVWLQPMMAEYLAPVAVAYLLRLWISRPRKDAKGVDSTASGRGRLPVVLVAIAAGLVAGMAPLIVYNVRHPLATLLYLTQVGHGGQHLLVAERFVTESLPILLGFAMPAYGPVAFGHAAAGHRIAYLIGLAVSIIILARLLLSRRGIVARAAALLRPGYGSPWSARFQPTTGPGSSQASIRITGAHGRHPGMGRMGWERPAIERDGVLALFGIVAVLFFVLSHFGAQFSSTSRPCYLIPLYTLAPLVLDVFLPHKPGRGAQWTAALAVGVLIVSGARLTLATPASHPIDGLVRLLERQHVRVIYANYWLAYRITFTSHERVQGISVLQDLRLGLVRTPRDLRLAARTPTSGLAWMFFDDRKGEDNFVKLLRQEHIHAHRTSWQGRVLYDHLSRPLRATGPYRLQGTSPPAS